MRAEGRLEVQCWLATLPESYRLVLILRYWHDLSYNEISETIGQPVSTARMRLFRARQSLGRSCRCARPCRRLPDTRYPSGSGRWLAWLNSPPSTHLCCQVQRDSSVPA